MRFKQIWPVIFVRLAHNIDKTLFRCRDLFMRHSADRRLTGENTNYRLRKTVLEAYVSAWNRRDFGTLDKLVTPDAVHARHIAAIDVTWRLPRVHSDREVYGHRNLL